jgi:hypothetical protein
MPSYPNLGLGNLEWSGYFHLLSSEIEVVKMWLRMIKVIVDAGICRLNMSRCNNHSRAKRMGFRQVGDFVMCGIDE